VLERLAILPLIVAATHTEVRDYGVGEMIVASWFINPNNGSKKTFLEHSPECSVEEQNST
jgi:hypothetical protein